MTNRDGALFVGGNLMTIRWHVNQIRNAPKMGRVRATAADTSRLATVHAHTKDFQFTQR